jgi:hypothetical protein
MVSNVENLNPQVIRHLTREIHSLRSEPMEGIAVLIDDKDLTNVEAVIDGPAETPYFGGKFKVRLVIGQDFPSVPPKGFFLTKIFHPNVGDRGEICVNTLKKDWKSDLVTSAFPRFDRNPPFNDLRLFSGAETRAAHDQVSLDCPQPRVGVKRRSWETASGKIRRLLFQVNEPRGRVDELVPFSCS